MVAAFLRRLDEHAFLCFRAWEFSFQSFFRPYGLWFLKRVVLRHPLAVLRGILKYRHLVSKGLLGSSVNLLYLRDEQSLLSEPQNLIIAPGYCQKPFSCPAGRFSSECILPQPCPEACSIKGLISAGLKLGGKVYVMTSALKIGQDILLPALEGKGPSRILAFVCPYSLHPFALACLICGLEGVVLTFAEGACTDYRAWLQADRGVKPEQTSIGPEAEEFLQKLARL